MMKILLIGAKGQLGSQIMHIIKNGKSELGSVPAEVLNAEIIETDVDTLDITNLQMVKESIKTNMPDVVINCAAFTNVDGCESSKDLAFKVNALGARNIAIACEEIGAKLIHVSTDYVFSGVGSTPLSEDAITAPVSAYGTTKLLGEDVFCVQMGHFHDVKEGKGSVVNGSIMGADDYSISHRWNAKPTQVLKVYYGEDEATYKLTVK